MSYLYMQDQEIKKLQTTIAFVTIVLSCFGVFLTFVFFGFNIRYRNFRLIKMSSPNINNIININCIILYLCPIFNSLKGLYILNEPFANSMCQVNAWFIPISSTAIYASMLTKAWRIYKIFETTPKMKKVVIKDARLVFYIICMISVDAIVLIIWQLFDSVKLKPRYVYETQAQPSQVIVPSSFLAYQSSSSQSTLLSKSSPSSHSSSSLIGSTLSSFISYDSFENYSSMNKFLSKIQTPKFEESSTSSNVETNVVPVVQNFSQTNQLKLVFECNSSYNEVWITILTMYKIILLMYGIYLAWIIRNINVPSMNDSKYLLLSTYAIIICGLGSMTLIQLLRDWPDVVQAFFTIGIILATCTTQCLVFIPKIRLWYKRRNDDNFKISLSQIFLQSSSSCYYSSDKQSRNSSATNPNVLNLEDELCELLHENSQLKNFLKEKEEIIKLLQDKIRITKATLFQVNEQQLRINRSENCIDLERNRANPMIDMCNNTVNNNNNNNAILNGSSMLISNMHESKSASMPVFIHQANSQDPKYNNNHDSGYDIDSSASTATTTTETLKALGLSNRNHLSANLNQQQQQTLQTPNTEQLKSDLDEVEELTTRVRDSISIDLSNTRRYSPLLYEYYRKQLELAKSIQCTYNIQCNSLFDAMTLMRKCLKDYCQTVHNPEYLAIDAINTNKNQSNQSNNGFQFSFNDYISKNNLNNQNSISNNIANSIHHHHHNLHHQSSTLPSQIAATVVANCNRHYQNISPDQSSSGASSSFKNNNLNSHLNIPNVINNINTSNTNNNNNNRNLKKMFLNSNSKSKTLETINNTFLTSLSSPANTSVESQASTTSSNASSSSSSSSASSSSSLSIPASYNNNVVNSSINNLNNYSNNMGAITATTTVNLNYDSHLSKQSASSVDNKQTYV